MLDSQKNLSISNIAVIIALCKLALTPSLSVTDIGMLLVTLLNYTHKRHVVKNSQNINIEFEEQIKNKISEFENKILESESNVAAVMLKSGLK